MKTTSVVHYWGNHSVVKCDAFTRTYAEKQLGLLLLLLLLKLGHGNIL